MVLHVYSDESRQTNSRFMLFSGIVIDQNGVGNFERTMAKYRKETNMHRELKWQKVSANKLDEYKKFIDYFFDLNNTDMIHFKCLIIDTRQINHKKFNQGDKETGFQKLYFQLLYWFGKDYSDTKDVRFIVHPDYRHTKYSLNTLKDILNNKCNKKIKEGYKPFRAIEPKDSRNSEIIQINDLLLGAIGYVKNGHLTLADSSKAKVELCKYILQKTGFQNLTDNSPYREQRFKIWNFKFPKY